MGQKNYSIERKQAKWGLIFTIPCLIFFAVFSFYPIINALITSLTNRRAIARTSEFVGLENYIYIFTKDNGGFPLSNSIRATLIFTIGTFIPMIIASLIIATFLMQLRKDKYRGFFQLMYYTPAVLSSVVAASIWMIIFDPRGLMNQISNFVMHTSGVDYNWLVDSTMLQISTMMIYFWKYIGYFVILFITGLAAIPNTIYEAATVDGSSRWHTFWKITLPLLKPTTAIASVPEDIQHPVHASSGRFIKIPDRRHYDEYLLHRNQERTSWPRKRHVYCTFPDYACFHVHPASSDTFKRRC